MELDQAALRSAIGAIFTTFDKAHVDNLVVKITNALTMWAESAADRALLEKKIQHGTISDRQQDPDMSELVETNRRCLAAVLEIARCLPESFDWPMGVPQDFIDCVNSYRRSLSGVRA